MCTLSENNIQRESIIRLTLRLGGPPGRLVILTHNGEAIRTDYADFIGSWKDLLSRRSNYSFGGIPVDEQHLFFNGRALDYGHRTKLLDRFSKEYSEYVGKDSWARGEAPIVDVIRVCCSCKKCVPWRDRASCQP